MPFDAVKPFHPSKQQKIAIIGSGISGLSAAWALSKRHQIVVYEKDGRLGGHSNTIDVQTNTGPTPVDTGFIVYNEPAYPNFTAFMAHLGVKTEISCMSFGVSMDHAKLEYSGQTLSSVFAQRSNLASPSFLRMLADIPRFHKDARLALSQGYSEEKSLGAFVAEKKYGHGFCENFLKPMAAAIWSTPDVKIFDYPAFAFLQFFANHGLLQVLNLPEWRTVSGGSKSYVRVLSDQFKDQVRLSCGVHQLERTVDGVVVIDEHGHRDVFDQVIVAAHADAALSMLSDVSDDERNILSAFQYQPNRAVLHMDEAHMPRRRRAWSSWNYIARGGDGAVSYWMNRLQNLSCKENIFVTLNPIESVCKDKLIATFDYDHPLFNAATAKAQKDIWQVQGRGGVWYAGAHLGHGFHEDGLQAGLAVAEAAGGVARPWRVDDPSGRLALPLSMTAATA